MSYLSVLSSVFGKRPLWLYYVRRDDVEWRWTNRGSDFVEPRVDFFDQVDVFAADDWFNEIWKSTALGHSRYWVTTAAKRAAVSIMLPFSNSMAQAFLGSGVGSVNKLIIFHEFENDPAGERVVKFRGRVIARKKTLRIVTLTAEDGGTELLRKGLTQVIQRPCRHALYHSLDGLGCNLDIEDFYASVALSAISGDTLTFDNPEGRPDGYYSGGVLSIAGSLFMVKRHTGTSLQLMGAVSAVRSALVASAPDPLSAKVAPGCDLSRATCSGKFNNLNNFGGFPWADDTPYDGKTLF